MAKELKCNNCNALNKPESKFCTSCGSKLQSAKLGPRLIILTKDRSSIIFHVNSDKSTIGRDMSNSIIINDTKISKHHLMITNKKGNVWLEDLNSRNGTYLNGRRIKDKVLLNDGNLIKIGSTILRFENGIELLN